MARYHLAQINVGRALGAPDSPVMAGFMAQLDEINAIADRAPGFVWRLQTAEGNATAIHAFTDPRMLLNISVWESVEALRDFVYRTAHSGVMRDRLQWFEKPTQAYMALWWISEGHIPTVEEALERLELRRRSGGTAEAFSFARTFPPPRGERAQAE